ncbi:hypothetical protein BDV33DRAFT_167070 [Aspergillus novoparasiticus]|uniref:Uncharacterized protein n=1 Tax=Aspergillus novoparasiticus TaxID=986946 RepID=A0A5N6F143_9EURO|nr:hypothetical protein BDV33DRAFT_167070 [Aspergillus novoparasiticus]
MSAWSSSGDHSALEYFPSEFTYSGKVIDDPSVEYIHVRLSSQTFPLDGLEPKLQALNSKSGWNSFQGPNEEAS